MRTCAYLPKVVDGDDDMGGGCDDDMGEGECVVVEGADGCGGVGVWGEGVGVGRATTATMTSAEAMLTHAHCPVIVCVCCGGGGSRFDSIRDRLMVNARLE